MVTRRRMLQRWAGVALMVVGGVAIVVGVVQMQQSVARREAGLTDPVRVSTAVTPTPRPTSTPEPIVPTRTPTPQRKATDDVTSTTTVTTATSTSVVRTIAPTSTATAAAMVLPPTLSISTPASTAAAAVTTLSPVASTATPTIAPAAPTDATTPMSSAPTSFVPAGERWRLGVSLPYGAGRDYDLAALGVGWVMDWNVRETAALAAGVAYAQSVRVRNGVLKPAAGVLTNVARARPGSLWLIGNEPDVRWQDNVTPEVYARLYHEAYTAIKAGDPTAVIAAGGIAQPSDLRLRYLDLVLQSYQAQFGGSLPAEAWHIHNYMLREERDSWGVDIPPGISDNSGALYAVSDSANLALFEEQIWTFRRWMASRDYGGQPLVVSEFGIPMPADYGFPTETVAAFLRETWRFFLTATDTGLGDPSDGGRLVQRWCWFSIAYPDYPTGDLVDKDTGAWTPLGEAWLAMVAD